MKNEDIRSHIKECGLTHWQVAKMIGVSDGYFSKILREDLPDHFKKALINAIDALSSGEMPDLSYFEERRKNILARKKISEEKRINKILDEIEKRRLDGGWGY